MQAQTQLKPQKGGRFRFWLEILLGVVFSGWGGFLLFLIVDYLREDGDTLLPSNRYDLTILAYGAACLLGGLTCLMRLRTIAAWLFRIAALATTVLGIMSWTNLVFAVGCITVALFLFLTAHWLSRGDVALPNS